MMTDPLRFNRTFCFSLVAALLLVTAHRLPAPIQEVPESPTPAPEKQAKPKKSQSKSKTVESESKTKSTAKRSATTPSQGAARFAGTWTGTMQTFPAGNQTTRIVIDSSETTMTVSWFGKTSSAKVQLLSGDTLQGTFPPPPFQPQSHVWSITPQADGQSARVHFQCFMNNFTAVFQKQPTSQTAAASMAAETSVPAQGDIPTARPVPNKVGFVYNPFDPNSKTLLDVRGKTSGTKVKDPNSGKLFIVP